MSTKDYHKTLPAKRMAAGAILRDEQGLFLIVEPTYKDHWEIPGGVVEALESPRAAVVREIHEELGLEIDEAALSLLSMDYLHESEQRTEAVMFLFLGPVLTALDIQQISLNTEELRSFKFATGVKCGNLLGPILGPRLLRASSGINFGSAVYHEDL